jgi:hypothetical protein
MILNWRIKLLIIINVKKAIILWYPKTMVGYRRPTNYQTNKIYLKKG